MGLSAEKNARLGARGPERRAPGRAARAFIGHVPEDEEHKGTVVRHLTAQVHEGIVDLWHPGLLLPGRDRETDLRARLSWADFVLFLVSSDFLASEPWERYLERAFDLHRKRGVVIVPILVRPVAMDGLPLSH